jgi:hypothetical protein
VGRLIASVSLLLLSACDGDATATDAAASGQDLAVANATCPVREPDPSAGTTCASGLQCQYEPSTFCRCGTFAGAGGPIQWSCGSSTECFDAATRCTPGVTCDYGFESGAACDSRGYWLRCGGSYCSYDDPSECPTFAEGDSCNVQLKGCPYPPGCRCSVVVGLIANVECALDGGAHD